MRVLALFTVFGLFFPAQTFAQLQIHHIDVNQGDATLIITPNGSTILIDAGKNGQGEVIADYLSTLNISTLDAFVLTHYHKDHLGGVDTMVDQDIEVSGWYDRGRWYDLNPPGSAQFQQYWGVAENVTTLQPGMSLQFDAAVSIEVVAVNGQIRGATANGYDVPDDENECSAVILISYDGFDYLLMGDAGDPVEERLILESALGDIDVLRVGHHGSHHSTTEPFLDLIQPEVAVISNGSDGGHNHPRQVTLDTLYLVPGITVYQTNLLEEQDRDQSGVIVGGNVPVQFIGDPQTDESDGHVLIVVQGNNYTVTLPATGHTRTFAIQRE